jgi:hypothetical protein
MSDYNEQGAAPVEDAAVEHPPTVDEVLERQRIEYPEQARTSTMQPDMTDEERATLAAGGDALTPPGADGADIEGPNSA